MIIQERGPEGREGQPGREGAKGREGMPGIKGVDGPEGPQGPRGNSISRPVKVAFLIITLIFFLTVAGFAWIVTDVGNNSEQVRTLIHENNERIEDIQESRTASCRDTYSGIYEVFRPFFPPVPRTPEQDANLEKFNDTIERLREGCTKQTDPEELEGE